MVEILVEELIWSEGSIGDGRDFLTSFAGLEISLKGTGMAAMAAVDGLREAVEGYGAICQGDEEVSSLKGSFRRNNLQSASLRKTSRSCNCKVPLLLYLLRPCL